MVAAELAASRADVQACLLKIDKTIIKNGVKEQQEETLGLLNNIDGCDAQKCLNFSTRETKMQQGLQIFECYHERQSSAEKQG